MHPKESKPGTPPIATAKFRGYILISIVRVSKHSVTILGLRVVTPAGLEPG